MTELERSAGRPMKAYFAAGACAALLLLASGWGYHVLAAHFYRSEPVKVMPDIPFKYFPRFIGAWEGRDEPISETVLKVAANDDYVCRIYHHAEDRQNASLYVAYTCEPRRMLGHRPEICYAGSGWTHEGTEKTKLTTSEDRVMEVLMHRFCKQGLAEQHIFVLNYYVVNGQITTDHSVFSGLKWRRPQVRRGQAAYVAQVQISSDNAEAAYALARVATDQILFHLPKTATGS